MEAKCEFRFLGKAEEPAKNVRRINISTENLTQEFINKKNY
jgi:hypothetical protein